MVKYSISFTSKDGAEATIKGDQKAVEAIERAFERAGIKFNREVETWDEGFYESTRVDDEPAIDDSVEQFPLYPWEG